MSYYGPFKFAVEDVHGNILARDIKVGNAQIIRRLSEYSEINFDVHPKEPSIQLASGPIRFRPWAQWIHALKEDSTGTERVWASCIVQPSDVDPETGILSLRSQGFSCYPKGIPWLQNWNPIAVDPFEIVERIWNHIQSYPNGDMGVTVYPTTSGTQMLPGFSFENEEFVQNFFAIFIRASDRNDCGDYINKLARDIPFDYFEESAWNVVKTAVIKKIRLGYPQGGTEQQALVFRLGENIIAATPKQESEINWFSDITINGYFPGKVYSSTLSNADPDRFRRVMDEKDLRIDSNERAAAWGHKLLTRRQIPYYFESIVIDPYHPNAPFLSYDVGDTIKVQGKVPWIGNNSQNHRIMAIIWDESKNQVQLQLMAEGAFNYDPITYGE